MDAMEIPQGIETADGIVLFRDIHHHFAHHAYGQRLAGQIRFASFKPPSLSFQQWEAALGDDVNNLRHLLKSLRSTQKFLLMLLASGRELSMRDMELLQLAAIVHDWHEAYPEIGDQVDIKKTDADREREFAALQKMVGELQLEAAVEARIHDALDEVLRDQTSVLGSLFRTIEVMGYMETGLKAWKRGSSIKSAFQEYFQYLAIQTFSYQSPRLLAQGTLPPVALFLHKHEPVLTDISELSPREFAYFPPEGIDPIAVHHKGLAEKFTEAAMLWRQRELSNQPIMSILE